MSNQQTISLTLRAGQSQLLLEADFRQRFGFPIPVLQMLSSAINSGLLSSVLGAVKKAALRRLVSKHGSIAGGVSSLGPNLQRNINVTAATAAAVEQAWFPPSGRGAAQVPAVGDSVTEHRTPKFALMEAFSPGMANDGLILWFCTAGGTG